MSHEHCHLSPEISEEEYDALDWLLRVMQDIAKKEGHKNQKRGELAFSGLMKVSRHCEHLHSYAHSMEDTMNRMVTDSDFSDQVLETARKMVAYTEMHMQERGEA